MDADFTWTLPYLRTSTPDIERLAKVLSRHPTRFTTPIMQEITMTISGRSSESAWDGADSQVFIRYGDYFVPERKLQFDIVTELLSDLPDGKVLDLCCGDGHLAEHYLERHPSRKLTLMDGSPLMLQHARERLRRFEHRLDEMLVQLESHPWRSAARYAGVMSSLAIHHLDGPGKRQIFKDILAMLKPGGAFVFTDLMEPASSSARALAAKQWDAAVATASQRGLGSNEALEAFSARGWNYYRGAMHGSSDAPSTVYEQLQWLNEAGFKGVDLVWMHAGHAILSGRKPW
ncbi:class I SAM-dependent methyltransferase [Frateuria aurantia]